MTKAEADALEANLFTPPYPVDGLEAEEGFQMSFADAVAAGKLHAPGTVAIPASDLARAREQAKDSVNALETLVDTYPNLIAHLVRAELVLKFLDSWSAPA